MIFTWIWITIFFFNKDIKNNFESLQFICKQNLVRMLYKKSVHSLSNELKLRPVAPLLIQQREFFFEIIIVQFSFLFSLHVYTSNIIYLQATSSVVMR